VVFGDLNSVHLNNDFIARPEGRSTLGDKSPSTFYAWKAKYGGMDVSQACKVKVLEDENARLKRLLADAMLDNAVLKEVAAKNW